jgi:hypothetical protein
MLTPAEIEQVVKQGGNPDDYVVMPCDVQLNPQGQLGLANVPTANGPVEVVIVPLVLAIPTASLRMSRLLDSAGKMPHPLDGMTPMLAGARLVVPRARLTPELAAALAGEREVTPANGRWPGVDPLDPDDAPRRGPGRLSTVNR